MIGADGRTQSLWDAKHERATLCELDMAFDANGDGRWSDDFCLDNSHYVFEGVAAGKVTVEQLVAPRGTSFGTLRFTPVELDGNNDRETLEGYGNGQMALKLSADRDRTVMLHVYNFQIPGQAASVPDSSTATSQPPPPSLLALWLLYLAVAGVVGLFLARWFLESTSPRT